MDGIAPNCERVTRECREQIPWESRVRLAEARLGLHRAHAAIASRNSVWRSENAGAILVGVLN
jgi:hypothetical protein